ncbi:MAG: NADH-quinone oxidoreductase subunit J [Pseudomonadota bacterium]
MVEQIVFYFFAALLVFAATMVITVRNPVHAALYLVLAFFSSAGLWLLLEAEFLAIALVLVYVGAVMVLFLFVVMMLDINIAELREGFARYLPIAVIVAIGMLLSLVTVVGHDNFGVAQMGTGTTHAVDYNNTRELGLVLYTQFIWPFEIAAVILLVAIVAAIALTLRGTRQHKQPKVERQLAARRDDRVRLIKVEAETE